MKKNTILTIITGLLLFQQSNAQTLDLSFGNSGKAVYNAEYGDAAAAMRIDHNGKILLAGQNGYDEGFIVRLNSDGTPDNTFGIFDPFFDTSPIGSIAVKPGGADEVYFKDIEFDSNNKIIASGFIKNGTDYDGVVYRLNTDGSIDNTFNSIGYVTLISSSNIDRIYDATVDNNNNIYVNILKTYDDGVTPSNQTNEASVLKISSNGTLDNSFGGTGSVSFHPIASKDSKPHQIVYFNTKLYVGVQRFDSRVYFGPTDYTNTIACLNLNGTIDASFGTNGYVDELENYAFNRMKINNNYIYTEFYRYSLNGVRDLSYGLSGLRGVGNEPYYGNQQYFFEYGNFDFDAYGNFYFFGAYDDLGFPSHQSVGFNKTFSNGLLDNLFGSNGFVNYDVDPTRNNRAYDGAIANNYIYIFTNIYSGPDPNDMFVDWDVDYCLLRFNYTPTAGISSAINPASPYAYPNPAVNGKLKINNPNNTIEEIILTNSLGQKEQFTDLYNISTNFRGLVFVELKSGTQSYYQKILINE